MSGMKDYSKSLVAGVWQRIDTEGDYIAVIDGDDRIAIRLNDRAPFVRRPGSGTPVDAFKKVELMSLVNQDVTVSCGFVPDGAPYDSAATVIGTFNVESNLADLRSSPADVVVPAGSAVQVLALDPTRLLAAVQLIDTAAGPVRIGGAGVSAANGTILYPDDIAYPTGRPAVFVYNPNAVDVTVTINVELSP